jgi:L-ascorbate 6-phosphate lactonase
VADDLSVRFRELRVPPGTIGICALGQAGFLLKGPDGPVFAIDPYLSDRLATDSEFGPPGRWSRTFPPPVRPEDLDVDAVLVTHEHPDHFDPLTLRPSLARRSFEVLGPPVLEEAVKDLGCAFRAALVGEPQEVSGAKVHAVPACHAVSYTGPDCYQVTREDGHHRFLGYVIEFTEDVTVYHGGDTVLDPEIDPVVSALAPRVSLLPMNGRDRLREEIGIVGNLTIAEAGHLAHVARTRWLIPSHHDLFEANSESVTNFVDVLDKRFSDQEYLIPKIGRPVIVGT